MRHTCSISFFVSLFSFLFLFSPLSRVPPFTHVCCLTLAALYFVRK
jgi:hypothetical protein